MSIAEISCDACGKPATTRQCPTCIKLKLTPAFYCSQDCFKGKWPEHKKVHVQVAVDPNPWPNLKFTGNLRPHYPLSPKRVVPIHITRPDYADDGIPRSENTIRGSSTITTLTPAEIKKLKTVCKLAREVMDLAAAAVKPGVTTDEIDRIVHEACIARNSYPSPLNYNGFPKSCCTSVNEVICHGIPDMRPLEDGDILNIDISLYYDGFHADMNETYPVGDNVDAAGLALIVGTKDCLMKAIEMCKPGVKYRDLGNVIQKIAYGNGHSVVKTYCGHGINRLFHCPPSIPHYSKNKAVGTMRPGHSFTIEPMINEGAWPDEHWPDKWTCVTSDGKRSAQFEHTLLITDTGVEILTA